MSLFRSISNISPLLDIARLPNKILSIQYYIFLTQQSIRVDKASITRLDQWGSLTFSVTATRRAEKEWFWTVIDIWNCSVSVATITTMSLAHHLATILFVLCSTFFLLCIACEWDTNLCVSCKDLDIGYDKAGKWKILEYIGAPERFRWY